jgi:hypothetical protein
MPEDIRGVIQHFGLTADQVATLVGLKDGRAVRRWISPGIAGMDIITVAMTEPRVSFRLTGIPGLFKVWSAK